MTSHPIAVHGGTGTQGLSVVRHLLGAGCRVRTISRRPPDQVAGLQPAPEPVPADLRDVDALTAAYAGVDTVVLQLPLRFDDTALVQARSVLAALGRSTVSRVVFNPGAGVPAGPVGVPFVDARAMLWAELPNVVGTVALVAPAVTYAENLAAPWSAPLIAAGEVRYPLAAEAPVPWVATADVAAVIGEVATAASPAPVQLVAGPADLTGDQLAAELSTGLGHPVGWRTISPDEYEQLLRPHLGPATAAGIAALYRAPAAAPDPSLLRRGGTTLRQWAACRRWSPRDPHIS